MPYKRQAAPTPGQIARQYHSGHACWDLFCERSTGLLAPARFEDVADLYVQQALLLAARDAPGRWGARLPDLDSRLRARAAAGLGAPSDAMRAVLLARLLSERQLALPAGQQAWLLERLPRSAAVLREVAARLDRASLASGRAPTRALVAAVVEGLEEDEGLAMG